MGTTLYAGAARRAINPELGTGMPGLRLFGSPIQAIESDLTATVLVLSDGDGKVALIGVDLCITSVAEAGRLRPRVAEALGTPVSHVLLNLSHVHSSPALPEFMAMTDSPRTCRSGRGTSATCALARRGRAEANDRLQPARIGTGWGESSIGVYRREMRDGRDVLGEVPDRPIDTSVGVIRVDDLEGNPIAVAFRYSAHPVTMGSRSQVASPTTPAPRVTLSSVTSAASRSSSRAAAATSTHASASATRSTAVTRRTASGSSSAARRSRSQPASAPTPGPASADRSATSPTSSSRRGSRSTATRART